MWTRLMMMLGAGLRAGAGMAMAASTEEKKAGDYGE